MASRTKIVVSYRIPYSSPSGKALLRFAIPCLDAVPPQKSHWRRGAQNWDQTGFKTVIIREIAIVLLAELNSGHITQAHDLRGRAVYGLHDDVIELGDIRKTAESVDRKLKGLITRHGRRTKLTGSHLYILSLDGVGHVVGRISDTNGV